MGEEKEDEEEGRREGETERSPTECAEIEDMKVRRAQKQLQL